MKEKWKRAYLNDVKCFLMGNFERLFYFTCFTGIICCFIIMVYKNQSKIEKIKRINKEKKEWVIAYSKLKKEHIQLLENHVATIDELKILQNENNIFGSLLGEIETNPTVRKIIDKIYGEWLDEILG